MEQFVIKTEYWKDNILMGHIDICASEDNDNDSRVWISDLYVAKSHRHTGIGTKLMHRALDEVKKLSIPRIYLYCKPELIHFYKRFGAEDTHQKKNGYHLMMLNNE